MKCLSLLSSSNSFWGLVLTFLSQRPAAAWVEEGPVFQREQVSCRPGLFLGGSGEVAIRQWSNALRGAGSSSVIHSFLNVT